MAAHGILTLILCWLTICEANSQILSRISRLSSKISTGTVRFPPRSYNYRRKGFDVIKDLQPPSRFFRRLCAADTAPVEIAGVNNPDLMAALETVEAPESCRLGGPIDIVKGGMVREVIGDPALGLASILIELPLPIMSYMKKDFQEEIEAAVKKVSWVKSPLVVISAPEGTPVPPPQSPFASTDVLVADKRKGGLKDVARVIAVASCKGGVGKSTTAVNLAYALRSQGFKVGIVDTDVHGPSLPIMVQPKDPIVKFSEDGSEIEPLVGENEVKLMSMGFINPTDSLIVRGARAAPLVEQMLSRTRWGELDYLVVDMPPGTSDIQLTLSQSLAIDAAVIVTTPQRLSFTDVVKGVEMFDKVGIPSVAVVENMAEYRDDALISRIQQVAEKHNLPKDATAELLSLASIPRTIFGEGHRHRLADMWGIENTYSMPIDSRVSEAGDSGLPLVVMFPEAQASKLYDRIATDLIAEVNRLEDDREQRPNVSFDALRNLVVAVLADGSEQSISPVELRRRCRSPTNIQDLITAQVKPMEIFPMGNYAVQIIWNDGHQSLMPYSSFIEGWRGGTSKRK